MRPRTTPHSETVAIVPLTMSLLVLTMLTAKHEASVHSGHSPELATPDCRCPDRFTDTKPDASVSQSDSGSLVLSTDSMANTKPLSSHYCGGLTISIVRPVYVTLTVIPLKGAITTMSPSPPLIVHPYSLVPSSSNLSHSTSPQPRPVLMTNNRNDTSNAFNASQRALP